MRKLFPFLAVLLLLPGCGKEEAVDAASALPAEGDGLVALEALPAPAGEPVTVWAGFAGDPETRSRIELNASRTQADVLWTRGDSFTVMYPKSADVGGGMSIATFTTQDDGVRQASFTSYFTPGKYGNYCFYPDFGKYAIYNGEPVFGFNLPTYQKAVAGGIEEGLNRAYAYAGELSADLSEPLKFQNAISLVKFRLEGAVVSRVKEVSFSCSGKTSGDVVIRNGNGLPEFMDLTFTTDSPSTRVILQGDFEAGKDYFIALWPQTSNGFRMEFSDVNGNQTTRQAFKSVTFERSRIKDFGTISLGNDFEIINDGSLDPVKYMTATEGTKPVTIAVVPEGFTREELPEYERLAKSCINALFETEPYKTYRNRFNVYFLKVASAGSGANVTDGNGNIVTSTGCYFGSGWGAETFSDMKANSDQVFEFVKEKCPDIVNGIHPVSEVPILMLINDSRYAGRCWLYPDGKSFAMVPYSNLGGGLIWSFPDILPTMNDPLPEPVTTETLQAYYRRTSQEDFNSIGGYCYGDWRNSVIHEFGGHALGRLFDEYWSSTRLNYLSGPIADHSWTVPAGLNVSSDFTDILWKTELLDRQEELVSRDANYGRIGVFQGGGTYLYGRWRSEMISCMIDNRLYFSAWQRYLITKRIFTLSGDLASFSFESWLAKDVTIDPVRDVTSSNAPGGPADHRTYTPVPPLPPPVLVD